MNHLLFILLTSTTNFYEPIFQNASFETADSLKVSRFGLKRIGLEKREYLSLNPARSKGYNPFIINLPLGVDKSTVIVTIKGEVFKLDIDYVIHSNLNQLTIINPKIVDSDNKILITYVRPTF